MAGFIGKRLIQTVFVFFLATLIVFSVMRILPGDPIYVYLTEDQLQTFTPEEIEAVRHELGLDRPMLVQYVDWLNGLPRGDFGMSMVHRTPVLDDIAKALPMTFNLGALSLVLAVVVGIALGIIAAVRRGKWADTVVTLVANAGITLPVFWLGILMIYLFSLKLGWLPTNGYTSPTEDLGMFLRQAIMPVICLMLFTIASVARQTRSAMLEVIQQDYIRTAWSKGVAERTVILKHALKNSLIPVVTLLGVSVRHVFGGAVLVETVFNVPGVGRLAVDAIQARDYSVVQGVILMIVIVVCIANLLVDISYGWIDPRIRYS